MPRDIPVGNGQMLVSFDHHYQVRDLYFPYVGQENHAGGNPCRFGVWAAMYDAGRRREGEQRKRRVCWSDDGWDIHLDYQSETLATDATLRHEGLQLELRCRDVVDFHRPVLVRRIEAVNLTDEHREIRLLHHHDFCLYGTKVGDTAYYDPQLRSLIHYRKERYVMASFYLDGEQQIDEYATGTAGFHGAEGTWRDAEDGHLGNNAIAQGAVDSTMMVNVQLPPHGMRAVYLVLGCGHQYEDLVKIHRFVHREGPQGVIDRTVAYWRLWLAAARIDFPASNTGHEPGETHADGAGVVPPTNVEDFHLPRLRLAGGTMPNGHDPDARGPWGGPGNLDLSGALPNKVIELFKRSLLVMRTQINNSGAIIAANDSDILQFSRDTYSYLWPRDGAFVADALDAAGFPDVSRAFFTFCAGLITDGGYFLHKYNPDGSPASSWHPWVANGKPQLPIQEDETALVVWALWRHYVRYRDIEFVRPLWIKLIQPAVDFLVRFRDPDTHLPLPSYDLWEERWGVHTFTVAAVHAALKAAWQFAVCFGDTTRAAAYATAVNQVRDAFLTHMWSEDRQRFLRRIVPLDHARTARITADVMAGRTPQPSGHDPLGVGRGTERASVGRASVGRASRPSAAPTMTGQTPTPPTMSPVIEFERDEVVDSSMYAVFALNLLPVDDERVVKTMAAIRDKLTVQTPVGGIARYEDDYYHQIVRDTPDVPGNPWVICTLWMAKYHIARARGMDDLAEALPMLEWAAEHARPSGVLAEQVHPLTGEPVSVSPLTWSHATVVSTVMAYLARLEGMSACPTCGHARSMSDSDSMRLGREPASRSMAELARVV